MNDATSSSSALGSLFDSLGTRARQRPEPRLSITLAGAGCALAVLGVLVVSGDAGSGDSSFNSIPGLVLSVLVVVAGFVTLQQAEDGPLATAGAAAAVLGVPAALFFVTFDNGSFPPYSSDTILVVSTIAWLVSYCVGPAKGRPVFLGAGLIGFWFSVLQVVEQPFDSPFGFFLFPVVGRMEVGYSSSTSQIGGGSFGRPFDFPDFTVLGLLSLAVGVAYVVGTRWLDRRSHHGAAMPFAIAAIPPLVAGTLFLADDLDQAGTGLLLAVIGFGLVRHGSTSRRRATTWIGGALSVIGLATIVIDLTEDATIGGLLLVAAGLGLVALGFVLARLLDEPAELAVTTGIAPMALSGGGPRRVVTPPVVEASVITAPVATIDPVPEPTPAPAKKATAKKAAAPAKKPAAKKAGPAPRRRPPTQP